MAGTAMAVPLMNDSVEQRAATEAYKKFEARQQAQHAWLADCWHCLKRCHFLWAQGERVSPLHWPALRLVCRTKHRVCCGGFCWKTR